MSTLTEKWLPVKNYEGLYEISNRGVIRGLDRVSRTRKVKGKVLKQAVDTYEGYPRVSLSKNGKAKSVHIHRILAEHFIPNPDGKPEINHKNSIRTDNRLENLEWVTRAENIGHAAKLGRMTNGDEHPLSVLTTNQVLEIRKKYIPEQYDMIALGEEYGVHPTTIGAVLRRKTWKHI